MDKKPKTKRAALAPQNDSKLTAAAVGKRRAKGKGKTEKKGEAQGEGGVRCSALLGDAITGETIWSKNVYNNFGFPPEYWCSWIRTMLDNLKKGGYLDSRVNLTLYSSNREFPSDSSTSRTSISEKSSPASST